MKDSVILGTGNSRYLKSVADFKTLYPTYDDFAAALVAGTLPVDFNGINTAGFQQVGDGLGKNTLLKDTTAALLGGDASMLPDDALVALKNLIGKNADAISANTALANTKAKIVTGSYTGTGEDTGVTINFPSLPKILFVYSKAATSSSDYSNFIVFPGYGGFGTNDARRDPATYAKTIGAKVNGNSVYLTGSSKYDFNAAVEYGYIAIV